MSARLQTVSSRRGEVFADLVADLIRGLYQCLKDRRRVQPFASFKGHSDPAFPDFRNLGSADPGERVIIF
jgi:hypothetical protein